MSNFRAPKCNKCNQPLILRTINHTPIGVDVFWFQCAFCGMLTTLTDEFKELEEKSEVEDV